MPNIGIICEYNPLHLGHKKQLSAARVLAGSDGGIICAMSGNFVQRGYPAVFDKTVRAKAAVDCGADLVLELPITCALSSAEGFAEGGVKILSALCDSLCFGAENADENKLMQTAEALRSPAFSAAVRQELDKGLSFPAARQAALAALDSDAALLEKPNNILAVEYCKAILSQNSKLNIRPVLRRGDYHDTAPDPDEPSATALRALMKNGQPWLPYIPENARGTLENAAQYWLSCGEKAILYRLRTMTEEDFEALPYGNEGLWRKLMHACREQTTLEEILTAAKSKRYTRSRLDRMVMCAFLGITAEMMRWETPYVRVLAFSDKGRQILKNAKTQGIYINAGQCFPHPYWDLEARCTDLHSLFATNALDPPKKENRCRIYYKK